MGINIGFNTLTAGSLLLATILLVLTAILFVSAASKVKNLPEYAASSKLKNGYKSIQTAYILTFVAAGICLILAFVYGGHEIWWGPSEWIHTVIFLAIIVLIIIADIYAYVVLNDLYVPQLPDRNGSDSFLWAGLWISVLALFMIMMIGSGRFGYNVVRDTVQDRFDDFKTKIEETHMHITGKGKPTEENLVSLPTDLQSANQAPVQTSKSSGTMRPPPPMGGQCPRPRPVVVHTPVGPVPPSRTVTSLGPPVKTTYTTVTQSQPVVNTVTRTMARTDSAASNFL
jgi:hypothetical protein